MPLVELEVHLVVVMVLMYMTGYVVRSGGCENDSMGQVYHAQSIFGCHYQQKKSRQSVAQANR
jgi:hypothetical protein